MLEKTDTVTDFYDKFLVTNCKNYIYDTTALKQDLKSVFMRE